LAASEVHRLTGDVRQGVPRRVALTISSDWFRVALLLLRIVTAPLIASPIVRHGGPGALDALAVLTILVAWSWVASGFVAWDRRPENRMGPQQLASVSGGRPVT
jgi:hypothetical protein